MGEVWNRKPNRCMECGKELESIQSGRIHVEAEHGIPWRKTRQYLKLIGG